MCDLGITPENFNPRVLYLYKGNYSYGRKFTYHSHDFVELKYILSGSCTYNINNEFFRVKKGDLVVSNPGAFHSKLLQPGDEITEFHAGFNNICIKDLPKDCIISQNACPVISLSKYEHEFIKCCNEILLEQDNKEPGSDLALKSLVMKLIVIFLKETYYIENPSEAEGVSFESCEKAILVNTILSFLDDNYMKDISLDKISRNIYLSPVYISKIFKEETGESPINHLIKIRLSKAKELLELGRLPIKAIAKSVGYHDVYHFSKLFKKYYGCPPSKHKALE